MDNTKAESKEFEDNKNLGEYRIDYKEIPLKIEDFLDCPFQMFKIWYEAAKSYENDIDVNCMALATCGIDGMPSLRCVLMREFDENGFVFYTHFDSKKGKQIDENPNVSVVFYWPRSHRQIRIEGKVEKVSDDMLEKCFNARRTWFKVSETLSPQSEVINSKEELLGKMKALERKVEEEGLVLSKQANFGGYRIVASSYEFWQGQSSRFHDRFLYSCVQKGDEKSWRKDILAP